MKKAQGLSLNTIIVATLALLVLILIALIFTGRVRLFRMGAEDCINQGGTCVKSPQVCTKNYGNVAKVSEGCDDEDFPTCCITSNQPPDTQ